MSFVQWNAHVHIEGAKAKWIGLGWGIPGDPGDPRCYEATITVTAPPEANATVGKVGVNESVVLKTSESLSCGPDGIELEVTYNVVPDNADRRDCREPGSEVEYNIAENAGQKGIPTGAVLANGTGPTGKDITVRVVVPGSCG
jgi:hypothetical protein